MTSYYAQRVLLCSKGFNNNLDIDLYTTSDLYVCLCDDGYVRLFKGIVCCNGNTHRRLPYFHASEVLRALYDDKVFIRTIHKGYVTYYDTVMETEPVYLNGEKYQTNCHLLSIIPFEKARSHLQGIGKITAYDYGKATYEEIQRVLLEISNMLGVEYFFGSQSR